MLESLLTKFVKKRLLHRCFLVNIVKFRRTSFFIEHLRWLLPDLFLACGSSCLEMLCKKGVLINFTKFTGKHKKEKIDTPVWVFSCEYCKIYKNSFSYRIPPLATSNRVPPPLFSNRKHCRK